MPNGDTSTWELPFGQPAQLELHTEWGSVALLPVGPEEKPRLELSRASRNNLAVEVEKIGDVVRVLLDPARAFPWFGGSEIRAALFVPRDVRAAVQTNAGSVTVRELEGCELGIKANAGKIELVNVYGVIHLAADAGSITGRQVGGQFDIETHAGSVRLEIVDLRPGEHRMQATMGSVRLELAQGIDLAIEAHTALGSVRNNYPSRAGAPTRLLLSSEMGSVRIDPAVYARPATRPDPVAAANDVPPTSDTRTQAPPDPELERVLKMVESGELSARDADELLQAMGRA